jgi:hypothetical protein
LTQQSLLAEVDDFYEFNFIIGEQVRRPADFSISGVLQFEFVSSFG